MARELKGKTTLQFSHQMLTVILLPVCTLLLSVCTFFLNEIYDEYKKFKATTEEYKNSTEKFRFEQAATDEKQNVRITDVDRRLTAILPKENVIPSQNH